jgi:hypothetical protein
VTEIEKRKTSEVVLDDLVARINAEHRAFVGSMRKGIEHAINAGELLAAAKKQCPHGTWLDWLAANFEGAQRTAQEHLRMYHHREEIQAIMQDSAHLSVSAALKQLAAPTRPDGISAEEWTVIKPAREYRYTPDPDLEKLALLSQQERRGWVAWMAWSAMLEAGREYSEVRHQVHQSTGPTEDLGVVDPDLLTDLQRPTETLRWWVAQVESLEAQVRACDYVSGGPMPHAAFDALTKDKTLAELYDDEAYERGYTGYPYPLQSPRSRIREFCGSVV